MAGYESLTWASANATTAGTIWQGWMVGTAASSHTYTLHDHDSGTVWAGWTVETRPLLSAEEVACQVEEVERATREAKAAAAERAERLLVEHLAPEQLAAYQRDRFFEVVAAKGRYRIYHNGAVRRLGEDGREETGYCIHPAEGLPNGDLALAKKLMLETDEAGFLRTANASAVGGVPPR